MVYLHGTMQMPKRVRFSGSLGHIISDCSLEMMADLA